MEFQKILPSDESIVMFAKIAVNQGRSPGLEKNEFYDAITKRAEALRADGESPQQAFSKVITDDETGRLLYKAMQIAPGAEVKPAPQEAAKEPEFIGPAHAKIHSMAVDHQRAHSGMSYQQAYSHLYSRPENEALRNSVKTEHMRATMASLHGHGLGKAAAPPDPSQDYVSPGPANDKLNELVMTRMKSDPKLSYQQAFTREYLLPANRSLKDRVDSEGILRAQAREPAKPFPAYARG